MHYWPSLTFTIDARRYFKQSEIALYRQAPEIAATPQIAQQQAIQQQVLLQQQQAILPPGSATAGPGREVPSPHLQREQQQQNTTPSVSAPAA
jgi:vacuolar protein sorting-associated protein 26